MADGEQPPALPGAARRPVLPMEFEGLSPQAPATGLPEFLWVAPTDLVVDDAYQRSLSRRSLNLIRRIAEDWDWRRFKPPIVARTDDGLEVIDGQHTAIAAATHGGIETIPVMVVQAVSQSDRASSFVGHNRDRLTMTPQAVHFAGLVSGDMDALAVQRVADAAGVNLLRHPPSFGVFKPRDCLALARIYSLVTARGPTRAREVLSILAAAELAPIADFQIHAIEHLLSEPEYKGTLSHDELTKALIAVGSDLKRQADVLAAEKRVSRWRACAVVIYRRATHGKRKAF